MVTFELEWDRSEAFRFAEQFDPLPQHLEQDGPGPLPPGAPSGYYFLALLNRELLRQPEWAGRVLCGNDLRVEWYRPLPAKGPLDIVVSYYETLTGDSRPLGVYAKRQSNLTVYGQDGTRFMQLWIKHYLGPEV